MEGEDGVEAFVYYCLCAGEQVRLDRLCILWVFDVLGDWGLVDIGQCEVVGGVVEELFYEQLADEAGGACDEDLHIESWCSSQDEVLLFAKQK